MHRYKAIVFPSASRVTSASQTWCASAVDETRSAAHAAFATCAEKIRLQLGRGKTRGAARQAIQTSETGRSIRERHDGGGV